MFDSDSLDSIPASLPRFRAAFRERGGGVSRDRFSPQLRPPFPG